MANTGDFSNGIDEFIQKLRAISGMAERITNALVEQGERQLEAEVTEAVSRIADCGALADGNNDVTTSSSVNGADGSIVLEGHDAAYLEFGVGIIGDGTATNPNMPEWAYGIGEKIIHKPGSPLDNSWFFNKDGIAYNTKGMEAGEPLYKTSRYLRNNLTEIVEGAIKNANQG